MNIDTAFLRGRFMCYDPESGRRVLNEGAVILNYMGRDKTARLLALVFANFTAAGPIIMLRELLSHTENVVVGQEVVPDVQYPLSTSSDYCLTASLANGDPLPESIRVALERFSVSEADFHDHVRRATLQHYAPASNADASADELFQQA